jgi:outer membrane protein TolC
VIRWTSLALAPWLLAATPAPGPWTLDDCVRSALAQDPRLVEARARTAQWHARRDEIASVYRPKLSALGWLAPTYGVRGTGADRLVSYDFRSWGPYVRLQVTALLPLTTFGAAEAALAAADARARVELAREDELRLRLARQVRELHASLQFARSMVAALDFALVHVRQAERVAADWLTEGDGRVTQVEFDRLRFGRLEAERWRQVANDGADAALAALKWAVGLPAEATLTLATAQLPQLADTPPPLPLPEALTEAAARRPEWRQVRHGRYAAAALVEAERRAVAPVLGVAGQLELGWSPVRDDDPNPYHLDPFNIVQGGVALALLWSFDPARSQALVAGARAVSAEVEAQAAQAAAGIDLQVRRANNALHQAREHARRAGEQVRAAQRWLLFASAAYEAGTGEARDLLDGLAAYVAARRTQAESLRDVLLAWAELWQVTGTDPLAQATP